MLWPFAGLLFWALLAGLVVLLAVLLLKRRDERVAAAAAAPSPAAAPASGASPVDVAEMRYARGELSREEFQALRADLQGLQDPRDAEGPQEPQPRQE
jgi:uncharacterized membrane protein